MTNQFKLIKLYFKGGLHLSQGKTDNYDSGQLRLHSDTLKSALFINALRLNPGLREKKGFKHQRSFFEKFKLSSAFPFVDAPAKSLFFLPKPKMPIEINIEGEQADLKLTSKIEYIEKSTLQIISSKDNINAKTENFTANKKFFALGHKLKDTEIFTTSTQQHVAIPRGGNQDGTSFFVENIFFGENAGLYFLVSLKSEEEKFWNQVKACIKLLGDSGIGTDKSTGGGQFEAKFEELPFKWQSSALTGKQMNLSLYWPQQSEVDYFDHASYSLIKRGGFIANAGNHHHLSIRKQSVYMFEEGSLFTAEAELKGRLGDLSPNKNALIKAEIPALNHPVWRDGQAIFIPL